MINCVLRKNKGEGSRYKTPGRKRKRKKTSFWYENDAESKTKRPESDSKGLGEKKKKILERKSREVDSNAQEKGKKRRL